MAKLQLQNLVKKNLFFFLSDNGKTGNVRFMIDKLSDIESYSVHSVMVNGKKRYVDCLKNPNGTGDCPLCKSGNKAATRVFFNVYNVDEDAAQIWERSVKQAFELENSIKNTNSESISNDTYKVTRVGYKGDNATKYLLEKINSDDIGLNSLPQKPEIYGKFIKVKTAEEIQFL